MMNQTVSETATPPDLLSAVQEHEALHAAVDSLAAHPGTSHEELTRMKKRRLAAKDRLYGLCRTN